MIISRRQLLGLFLTTGAAGTILTDQAVANAIRLVPVDPITEVVRRGRELVLAHQIDSDPRNPVTTPGRTVKVRWSTASLSPYRLVSPSSSIMRPR